MRTFITILTILLSLGLFAGCSTPEKTSRRRIPRKSSSAAPVLAAAPAAVRAPVTPVADSRIEELARENAELRSSAARIEELRAQTDRAIAERPLADIGLKEAKLAAVITLFKKEEAKDKAMIDLVHQQIEAIVTLQEEYAAAEAAADSMGLTEEKRLEFQRKLEARGRLIDGLLVTLGYGAPNAPTQESAEQDPVVASLLADVGVVLSTPATRPAPSSAIPVPALASIRTIECHFFNKTSKEYDMMVFGPDSRQDVAARGHVLARVSADPRKPSKVQYNPKDGSPAKAFWINYDGAGKQCPVCGACQALMLIE